MSDLGLDCLPMSHCLPMFHKKDARLKRLKLIDRIIKYPLIHTQPLAIVITYRKITITLKKFNIYLTRISNSPGSTSRSLQKEHKAKKKCVFQVT